MLDVELIYSRVSEMQSKKKFLFTCPWWNPVMNNAQEVWFASDFFIIDAKWERTNKVFPLRYAEFRDKYLDMMRYLGKWNIMVERLLFSRYLTACAQDVNENTLKIYSQSKLLEFSERSPVHYNADWMRIHEVPKIWLYMGHSLEAKRKMLNDKKLVFWKYSQMLKDWDYIDPTWYII
jgi:hypothetical protein